MNINYKLINGIVGRLVTKCYCSKTFNKIVKVYIYKGLIDYTIGDGIISNSISSYIIMNYC